MRGKPNLPYHSDELDEFFGVQAMRLAGETVPADPSIKTVGVVGALFDKDHNLYYADQRIIEKSLRILKAANISMSQNIQFHFYNLLAPISSDFLFATLIDKSAPKADALILCDLKGDTTGRTNFYDLRYDQQVQPYENLDFEEMRQLDFYRDLDRRHGTSPLQQHDKSWSLAAAHVGAKIVIIDGSDN